MFCGENNCSSCDNVATIISFSISHDEFFKWKRMNYDDANPKFDNLIILLFLFHMIITMVT